MSASSRRIMAFHALPVSRIILRFSSSSLTLVPNCPTETLYKGLCNNSAMASAVKLLPVPGSP